MKKILLILLILFGAQTAQAQNPTTVTGTIVDTNAIPYFPATVTACLAPNTTDPIVGGKHVNNNIGTNYCIGPNQTNSAGTFSMGLFANGVITPAATTWVFYVAATGSPAPLGSGAQNFQSSGITISGTTQDVGATLSALAPKLITFNLGGVPTVTVNPVTCATGQTFFNTSTGQFLLCIAPNVISTASGSPATTIDMKQYGVVADLRTCQGTAGGTTNGSPTFTCTTGAFCNAGAVACPAGQGTDVGKRINGTGACCNLSVPVNTNSQIIPNNCTILSVQSATSLTMSCNATATETANNGLFVFWATDDDAAVTLADTAYVNAPVCTALLWPATPFLVKNPHFNTAPTACESLEHGGVVGNRVPYSSYIGWGSSNSVMYLDASLNANTACPLGATVGCFFSQGPTASVHIQHIGISGGWNQVPNGGGHSYVLINLGQSADVIDLRAVGFSSGDGTTIGLEASSFSNFTDTYFSGFGNTGLFNNGASNVFRGGEFSNVNGACALMGGSANVAPVLTYAISFGTCSGPTVQVSGGPWISNGDLVYANGPNGTCVFITGAGASANITGGIIGSNGSCTTNGILLAGAALVTLMDTQITSTVNAVNIGSSGAKFTDHCGNRYTGTLAVTAGGIVLPCTTPQGSTFAVAPAAGLLNCSVNSASPAVCGGYGTGHFVIPTTTTSYTVNTSMPTANQFIDLSFTTDNTGFSGAPTCVMPLTTTTPNVSARTSGTSFTVSLTSTTGTVCAIYNIHN